MSPTFATRALLGVTSEAAPALAAALTTLTALLSLETAAVLSMWLLEEQRPLTPASMEERAAKLHALPKRVSVLDVPSSSLFMAMPPAGEGSETSVPQAAGAAAAAAAAAAEPGVGASGSEPDDEPSAAEEELGGKEAAWKHEVRV